MRYDGHGFVCDWCRKLAGGITALPKDWTEIKIQIRTEGRPGSVMYYLHACPDHGKHVINRIRQLGWIEGGLNSGGDADW